MLKAKEIIDRNGRGIPYVMVISYILEKGQDMISEITDKQIEAVSENGFMTKEFAQVLIRTSREVVKNCDQNDIIRLIKAEWCCSGEVYDPDLDQFVTDLEV